MAKQVISPVEFAERRARLAEAAAARGLAAVLVWSLGGASYEGYGDVVYLTDHHPPTAHLPQTPAFTGSGYCAVLVPTAGEPTLVTTVLGESPEPPAIDDARLALHLPQEVGKLIRDRGLSRERIGLIGRETLLASHRQILEDALDDGGAFVECDDMLGRIRAIKSDAELELIRAAAEAGHAWMSTTLGAITEGATEAEAVAAGVAAFIRAGGAPYDVALVAHDTAGYYWGSSNVPHWSTERRFERGDMVHCDAFGPVGGYYTDFARSTTVGDDPTAAQLDVLEGSIGVVEAIIAAMKPGVTASELYAHGVRWLAQFSGHSGEGGTGLQFGGDNFPAFGHSFGLTMNEDLHLVAGDETPLEANMTIAIEANVAQPGVGAALFEQNVVVRPDGPPEILTWRTPTRPWL